MICYLSKIYLKIFFVNFFNTDPIFIFISALKRSSRLAICELWTFSFFRFFLIIFHQPFCKVIYRVFFTAFLDPCFPNFYFSPYSFSRFLWYPPIPKEFRFGCLFRYITIWFLTLSVSFTVIVLFIFVLRHFTVLIRLPGPIYLVWQWRV